MAEYITVEAAVGHIKSGNRVFIQGGAATPLYLINALLARAGEINDVELTCISLYGNINWRSEEVMNRFYLNSLFASSNVRDWVNSGRGGFVPVFLSEIGRLFDKGILPLDVAMIQVSMPDAHGYCTLGPSVDVTMSAVRNAKKIIAQVNPLMPRVYGEGLIHASKIDAMVWQKAELQELDFSSKLNEQSREIGRHVASIIEDGSTLQMGIGAIPDAVLSCLDNHKGLGIHTEMFSDGIVPLVEKGVITNEHKKIHRGKIISSFVLGTKKVYDFINGNQFVNCLEASYVNDTSVIRKNPKMVAVNSAIEIDLTGQVCADSIGTCQYSGIGGQMDFMRGASLSEGGKPVIALPSVTNKGVSRIVPFLKQGAGVVTTRGHIQYVATEYGLVNLYGKNLEQRAKLLIGIAHPDHRESLEREYFERFSKPCKV
ncbi:MAG: acetyl-CoA hydrolase/transferase family protein [Sphingobacteriales bacterium]|nr:MAG: acetyl-CoA hydrolase/transferase family protein [Sphingobacteriales bacterium]